MFTTTLAEVITVTGRTLTVQPLFSPSGVKLPVITGVQLGLFGNSEQFVDVHIKGKTADSDGDIVLIIFTTFDISNYMTFGNKDIMDTSRRNDINSCVALPFTFKKHTEAIQNPQSGIHMKGYALHQGQKKHEGDLNRIGETEITGAFSQAGDMEVDGNIHAEVDVVADTVSLKSHIHINTKPGSPTETSGIPKI